MKYYLFFTFIIVSLISSCEKENDITTNDTTDTTTTDSSLVSNGEFSTVTIATKELIDSIVENLIGEGVIISNISSNISLTQDSSIGYFNKYDNSILGMKSGLVLSTGKIESAFDPNYNNSTTTIFNKAKAFDSNLQKLLDSYNGELGQNYYDLTTIEFDLIIESETLVFNFVFASEEYPEYVDSGYSDIFAFFLSGPTIVDTINLAKIDNKPISVATINANKNSDQYKSNGTGTTPSINNEIQYDGLTTKIQIQHSISPHKVYHLKILIADIRDALYDSAVFIENESLSAN
jgi:hypothetical protein